MKAFRVCWLGYEGDLDNYEDTMADSPEEAVDLFCSKYGQRVKFPESVSVRAESGATNCYRVTKHVEYFADLIRPSSPPAPESSQ